MCVCESVCKLRCGAYMHKQPPAVVESHPSFGLPDSVASGNVTAGRDMKSTYRSNVPRCAEGGCGAPDISWRGETGLVKPARWLLGGPCMRGKSALASPQGAQPTPEVANPSPQPGLPCRQDGRVRRVRGAREGGRGSPSLCSLPRDQTSVETAPRASDASSSSN